MIRRFPALVVGGAVAVYVYGLTIFDSAAGQIPYGCVKLDENTKSRLRASKRFEKAL